MSFGFSPSDIITLVTLAAKTYRSWRSAVGDYSEITNSLDSLLIILERIEDEAEQPRTALVRSKRDRNDLDDIITACHSTVQELNSVIAKYRSLGLGKSREKNWDRIWFGSKNLDSLKAKLLQHESALSVYLNAVGLSSLSRIERDLHALPEQIQRTVDGLAAEIRAGRREGSIMTTYDDDEKEVWKQFRRELIGDGMKSSFVHKYKPNIRRYLRGLANEGLLEEAELQPEDEDVRETTMSLSHRPEDDDVGCPDRLAGPSPQTPSFGDESMNARGVTDEQESADKHPKNSPNGFLSKNLSAGSRTPELQGREEADVARSAAMFEERATTNVINTDGVDLKPEVAENTPLDSEFLVDSRPASSTKPYQATCETDESIDQPTSDDCSDDVLMVTRESTVSKASSFDNGSVSEPKQSFMASVCRPSDPIGPNIAGPGKTSHRSDDEDAQSETSAEHITEGPVSKEQITPNDSPKVIPYARTGRAHPVKTDAVPAKPRQSGDLLARSGSPEGVLMERLAQMREETTRDWPSSDDDNVMSLSSSPSLDSDAAVLASDGATAPQIPLRARCRRCGAMMTKYSDRNTAVHIAMCPACVDGLQDGDEKVADIPKIKRADTMPFRTSLESRDIASQKRRQAEVLTADRLDNERSRDVPQVKRSDTMPYNTSGRVENTAPRTSRKAEYTNGLVTPLAIPEYSDPSESGSIKSSYGRQFTDDYDYVIDKHGQPAVVRRGAERPPTLSQSRSSPADIKIPREKPRAQFVQVDKEIFAHMPRVKRAETMPYGAPRRPKNIAPSRETEYAEGLATATVPEHTDASRPTSTKSNYGNQYADDMEYPTPDGYRTEVRQPTHSARPNVPRKVTRSPSPVRKARDTGERERERPRMAAYRSSTPAELAGSGPSNTRATSYIYTPSGVERVRSSRKARIDSRLFGEVP